MNFLKIKELKKNKKFRIWITFFAVVFSAIIQAGILQIFVNPSNLLSSGFTGVAILIDKIAELNDYSIPIAISIIILNTPVAIMCYKSIGLKFTIFSLLQVFLLSLFLSIFSFKPIFDDVFLNVIFGGFLNGVAVVIALKGGASTGGTDFIALYVSNKKGKAIWKYLFIFNVIVLFIFGFIVGWQYAGYSIIFQYISTQTITTFHQRYNRVTLQITTSKSEEVISAYISKHKHGISCVEAIGGYSKQKMFILHTVVSADEVTEVVECIKESDPCVIINMFKTAQFFGKFNQSPIE